MNLYNFIPQKGASAMLRENDTLNVFKHNLYAIVWNLPYFAIYCPNIMLYLCRLTNFPFLFRYIVILLYVLQTNTLS